MKSFKEFINEVLITFGGQAYPKFNQIVILAGGAGSGKGFIKDNLLGIEGRTLDVDSLKKFLMKSDVVNKKLFGRTGSLDLGKPEDVYTLHIISKYLGIEDKLKDSIEKGIDPESMRKPNLIFDVTLKDFNKLEEITSFTQAMGYKKEDTHLVWILNDIEIAKSQNAKRERVVPEEILITTHRGAAITMGEIIKQNIKLRKYLDGDITVAFNRAGLDTDLKKSSKGGSYLKNAAYSVLKKKGQSFDSSKMTDSFMRKINDLTKLNIF